MHKSPLLKGSISSASQEILQIFMEREFNYHVQDRPQKLLFFFTKIK